MESQPKIVLALAADEYVPVCIVDHLVAPVD